MSQKIEEVLNSYLERRQHEPALRLCALCKSEDAEYASIFIPYPNKPKFAGMIGKAICYSLCDGCKQRLGGDVYGAVEDKIASEMGIAPGGVR